MRSSRSNFVDLTRFYAGIENDYNKSGVSTGVIYDVSSAPQDLFTSGRVHCDTAGNLRWETALLINGGSQITGVADGATLVCGATIRMRIPIQIVALHSSAMATAL